MLTGKISERNGVGIIFNESIKTRVVDVLRKSNRIIAVKLVLEPGLAIIISVKLSSVLHSWGK